MMRTETLTAPRRICTAGQPRPAAHGAAPVSRHGRQRLTVLGCLVTLFALLGCAANPAPRPAPPAPPQVTEPSQAERDEIFSLLAFAVVQRQWQAEGVGDPRGYNIGSVLVDKNACVVYWGLNSVNLAKNKTQHGEVRLMSCYLDRNREAGHPLPGANLKDYSIYTTLEPCAMCSGMMVLQAVRRTVYGQKDPGFGDALERLEFDGEQCGGYRPYPRPVPSVPSTLALRDRLETLFRNYCAPHPSTCSITDFLTTAAAKQVYDDALAALRRYQPRFPQNQPVLAAAQRFYEVASRETPMVSCPDLPEPSCPLPVAAPPEH
jgi:tRNA(adenine34) deaminase